MMRKKLLEYMKSEGVTMVHIAKKLEISTQHLNNYLKGTRTVSSAVEKRIAEFLKSKGRL